MLNFWVFLIFLLSISAIIFILYKKLPLLKEIELKHTEREKNTKYTILEQRLKRKLGKTLSHFSFFSKTGDIFQKTTASLKNHYTKVKGKKNVYLSQIKQLRQQKQATTEPEDSLNNSDPLQKAASLYKLERYQDAEDEVIEYIKKDPKSLTAYRLLGEIYFASKNFIHAEATWEHIVQLANRLKKTNAMHYIELARSKLKVEKLEDALQAAKKAVFLEPLNPKILHFIVRTCIAAKQKDMAWKYYHKLKKVNPENEGLDDLLEELKGL